MQHEKLGQWTGNSKVVSNAIYSIKSVFIGGECTGKDLEGIQHITVSSNSTVSSLTPRSKENLHLH